MMTRRPMPDLVQRQEDDDDSDSESECDLDESLPPEEQGDSNISELHDQFEMESDHDYSFDRIVDHEFKDGVLILKVRYQGDEEHLFDIPFSILKKDVPLEIGQVHSKQGG